MFVNLVTARHLADAEHSVIETPKAYTTVVFVFLTSVGAIHCFIDAAVTLVAVYVIFSKSYSARTTFLTMVKWLLVLVDEAHKFAYFAVHRAELEPAFYARDAKGLFFAALSTFYHGNVVSVQRMLFDVVVTLSTAVKFLADRTLL